MLAGHPLELAHLLGGGPGAIHGPLGVVAQVIRQTCIGHQKFGIANGQRQLVGDAILHRTGGHPRAFEPRRLRLRNAARVFGPQVHRHVHHDGPAGHQNDRQC